MAKYLFILFSFLSSMAMGNIAAPPEPGSGNITGQNKLQSVSVLNEDLTIDLSGAANAENARIRAFYTIYSANPIVNLELVFVGNNLSGNSYVVKIDGQPVNGFIKEFDTIPQDWFPPDSVKFRNTKVPFNYNHKGLISFTIDSMGSGEHTLEVTYEAGIAEWFGNNDLAVTKAFVYILKPSSGWKEFKNLNLNIVIPDGWEYSSNLDMDRQSSNELHGFWEALPAHHLSVAFRHKESKTKILSVMFIIFSMTLTLFLLLKWMVIVIKYRLRNNKHRFIQILNGLLVSLLVTVAFYAIYFTDPALKDYLLDGQLSPLYSYGLGYLIIFEFPVYWIASLVSTFVIDYFLTKRIKKKMGGIG